MKLSDTEWQIMNALWKHHPASAREMMEKIEKSPDWAYTTVKTMLSRLVAKGAMSEEKQGNTSYYTPLISENKMRRSALRTIIDRVLGGSLEPVMHYLAEERKLSSEERNELIRILEEMNQKPTENNNDDH